jgi:hypothetical protein
MVESIIKPKVPKVLGSNTSGWVELENSISSSYPLQTFGHIPSGLRVLSAVEVVKEDGKLELGPEFHISISKNGKRCDSAEAAFVLHAFNCEDAKEDNHTPHGIVRHFWRPVADNLSGYECPCVSEEPAIVEDKGDYIWRGTPHG